LNFKIEIFDSLRAFAALSVCLFHFICTTTGFIQNQWLLNVFSPGKYGVQLFFVISGFIIPWAMFHARFKLKDFGLFLLKRLSRLEPPYLFSIALVLLVLFVRENYFGRENAHIQISATQVALHLGYLIPFFEGYQWLNQVYWTLAIEFQYYLLIALIFVPLTTSGKWLRYITYALIIALSMISAEKFIFYWLPIFLLGILLFLYMALIIDKKEYYISSVLVLLFCLYKFPVGAVAYAVIPIICVLTIQNVKVPVFDYIGKFSYSLYLIHPIIGASLINILSHYVTNPLAKTGVIFAGLALTLISAWLTYILIERPSKRLSSSIKYKNTETKNQY